MIALTSGFEPGARVATARPGYVPYRNVIRALHLEPVEIACGPEVRFQLTPEALEALDPAPAAVITASPANPTETLIPPEDLAAIAEVCRRRNIRIISDEIYHGLSYVEPARSMLEFAPDALVLNSFSNTSAWPAGGGWLAPRTWSNAPAPASATCS